MPNRYGVGGAQRCRRVRGTLGYSTAPQGLARRLCRMLGGSRCGWHGPASPGEDVEGVSPSRSRCRCGRDEATASGLCSALQCFAVLCSALQCSALLCCAVAACVGAGWQTMHTRSPPTSTPSSRRARSLVTHERCFAPTGACRCANTPYSPYSPSSPPWGLYLPTQAERGPVLVVTAVRRQRAWTAGRAALGPSARALLGLTAGPCTRSEQEGASLHSAAGRAAAAL